LFLLPVLLFLLAACQPIRPATGVADGAPTSDANLARPLPFDPSVRMGKLDNGLTYYIRQNAEPEERAELWLAVNAGSVMEDDDQKGLAHFVEHMLFNGTRNFEGRALVDYFERIGMEFGPDVNAYTSWDETVYTLQVPTDDPEILATGLQILEEWAAHATISPEEVDAERGVIVEEWRLRDLNAQGRTSDELVKTLLANSRYAKRLPIGDMEIVQNAPAETLKRFYSNWYRPENQAVIAVGDFDDLDAVEAMIIERFSTLPQAETPLERPAFPVEDYGATNYRVVVDPEFPSTVIYVVYKQDVERPTTVSDFRKGLVGALTSEMLNLRLDDLTRQADAPFLFAVTGDTNLVRPTDVSFAIAQAEEGGAAAALEAVMTEIERVRQHGFAPVELEQAAADMLRNFKSAYDERNNIENAAHADAYLSHFLQGITPLSEEDNYTLAQELLSGITLDEVNRQALKMFPQGNRAVIVIAPKKEGVAPPNEDQLAEVMARAESAKIEPYAAVEVADALMQSIPEPAGSSAETTFPELGLTVITLTNGVRVYMKPTDFKDDEVLLTLHSPGGSSLVEDGDFLEADLATNLVTQSGVGDFSQTELQRALAGKSVSVNPFIDDVSEGVSASGSPQDLETLLQLLHLYLTDPASDPDAFVALRRQISDFLKNRSLTPESALEDAYLAIFCGDNIRCNYVENLQDIDEFDLERAIELYRDRFADLSDATVLIVGSFDPAQATTLAQSYIGSLPGGSRQETWIDRSPELPQGVISETVNRGKEARSVVQIVFSGPFTPTVENRVAARLVESVLDIQVREDLREARGGIYGAGVSVSIDNLPRPTYSFEIQFTAEPTRVAELVEAVYMQIADLRTNGPSADNFAKAHEQARRNHEENLKDNGAWMSWLGRYLLDQEDEVSAVLRIDDAIASATPAEVQAMAQQLFPTDRHVTLILHPEGFTE
jgi:zinc protease